MLCWPWVSASVRLAAWEAVRHTDIIVPDIDELMQVTTTKGNVYSYSPRTNEIVLGESIDSCDYAFQFMPIIPFREMPNLGSFIINVTEQCNLRCSYCCYSGIYENSRTHGNKSIGKDDVPVLLEFIENNAKKHPINFSFYGGEPLLKYELVQSIILQSEQRWGDDVNFYVATNGVLLDERRIDWLVEHNVMIAISVDGTEDFHNRYRRTWQGEGSFGKAYAALAYLKRRYTEYQREKVLVLTTVTSFDDLAPLSESWHRDPVLHDIAPTSISALAPNFIEGVAMREWSEVLDSHEKLLNLYEAHRNWIFLNAYFNECVMNWIKRPIMDVGNEVPLSTCLPQNDKIFIDSYGKLHVCEKISNLFSIGSVKDSIDWNQANELAFSYYNKRKNRCQKCPAIRMCSLCLTSIEFNEKQMDVLCHNERIYTKINFWLFCEMAERGMIT
jgi:uncharacterized protein